MKVDLDQLEKIAVSTKGKHSHIALIHEEAEALIAELRAAREVARLARSHEQYCADQGDFELKLALKHYAEVVK